MRIRKRVANYFDSRQLPNNNIKRECNDVYVTDKYFYYISDLNEIYECKKENSIFENEMIATGNYFRRPEDARQYMIDNNFIIWNELKIGTHLISKKNKKYIFKYFEPKNRSCFVTDALSNKDIFMFCSQLYIDSKKQKI